MCKAVVQRRGHRRRQVSLSSRVDTFRAANSATPHETHIGLHFEGLAFVLNPDKYDVFLSQGRWFGRLAPSLRRMLLEPSTLVVLATGEELYAKGDACDGLYALIGGEILLGNNTRFEPPEWFGINEVLVKAPRETGAMARVQTRLVHIAQPVLDLLLTNSPRVLEAVRELAGIATLNPFVPRMSAPRPAARRQPALISASP